MAQSALQAEAGRIEFWFFSDLLWLLTRQTFGRVLKSIFERSILRNLVLKLHSLVRTAKEVEQ
jgi:hypothetical protein